jgi:hypothetical protein
MDIIPKRIKSKIINNLSYLKVIIKEIENLEDKRLTSNKLKAKTKTWLQRR